MPIKFVDREAGESKMSSFIVVEALGLVTWWGLGRIVHGVRGVATGGRGKAGRRGGASAGAGAGAGQSGQSAQAAQSGQSGQSGNGAATGQTNGDSPNATDTEDPIRSV